VTTEPLNGPQKESKCVFGKSTNCRMFQDQMIHMEGSLQAALSVYHNNLQLLESHCQTIKDSFDQQLADASKTIQQAQIQLSAGTALKTQSMQTERLDSKRMAELREETDQKYTDCEKGKKEFVETLCALTKLRMEIIKKYNGQQGISFVMNHNENMIPEDCEVTKWIQDECSASCGKGVRTITRTIITPPKNNGTPCRALKGVIDCNVKPCPIDCIVGEWDGWSACTADCGGGVQTRNRKEKRSSEHGGKTCDREQQTQICNSENCDTPCELSEWTLWTLCSKACNIGFQHRNRQVLPHDGAEKCPSPDETEQLRSCNLQDCPSDIKCADEIDLVLLLDGSVSMGQGAFDTLKHFASHLVKRFNSGGATAKIGAIEYSGPATFDEWEACNSGTMSKGNCGIKQLSALTGETESLSRDIESAEYIGESTNTAGALATARNLLETGRQNAPSVVLAVMFGKPNNEVAFQSAASQVKESARLVFVPVAPNDDELEDLKTYSSQPVFENILTADSFEDLDAMIPNIVATLCPNISSESDSSLGKTAMESNKIREGEGDSVNPEEGRESRDRGSRYGDRESRYGDRGSRYGDRGSRYGGRNK